MHGSIDARDVAGLSVRERDDDVTDDIISPPMHDAENASSGIELSFFCPDVTDASTLKRVRQFMDFGFRVVVFGFRRARYNTTFEPPWPNVPLGFTTDARYWHRLCALLRAVPAIVRHRRTLRRSGIFYARNIDQLLLALIARATCGSRARIVYEVLDIPPILMQRGVMARMLRRIERMALRRIALLVLSSPGFHRNYYKTIQGYRGEWFLLENKLHHSIPSARPRLRRPVEGGRPWVVGYFGLIRGEATFALISRLADRLQGRVLFKFGGIVTTVDRAGFDRALRRSANMVYSGPYLPQQDLERLYRDVDIAWALDLEHTDHNSRWLMPCRFYEAGFYGVPCMAVQGFEVGTTIEKHGIGWTFDEPLEDSLVRFFERLTLADYADVRQRLDAVPPSTFVAGEDITRLCSLLA
ncbi:MAG: hypothetical protein AB7F22_10930 [Reyranella sp.]|uniref:hypothetical protein n=1 Tax=Reyranella sp. TaxID=1929291 RepID=UPI003D11E25A